MIRKICKSSSKILYRLFSMRSWHNSNIYEIQLNEYETALYFLQLSQNMTSDCLFTFVFFPEFTCFARKIVFIMMFRTIFGAKHVNSDKNREIQSLVMFWQNMEQLSNIHLAVASYDILNCFEA